MSSPAAVRTFEDGLTIRPAVQTDAPVILSFIRQLADYERLLHRVEATEADLVATLFGSRPAAEVLLAISADRPVGFALFFQNYSTFLGRPGIYLEDLFVIPEARGQSVGRRLLSEVANVAVARGGGRLEWAVLDWNQPAIGFYQRMGATILEDWRVCRLTGTALQAVAHRG
jgi:GNAT superfamily N-acetyltransferase